MKSGDFVSIDYVGRVKESGEIFDLTVEEVAKKENVYNPKMSYKPVNVVIDGAFVIRGLDDALKEMNVGDKKKVEVTPENGFGERSAKMITAIPLSSFKNEKVDPTPGSWVNVNGVRGKILSSDGGRIRVDFNHPLAGKTLVYDVEVKRQITDDAEKVRAIANFITSVDMDLIDAKINGREADIVFRKSVEVPQHAKKKIAELCAKWVSGVEKVRFVDEYDGKKTE